MGMFDWIRKKGVKEVDLAKKNINYEEIHGTAEEIKKMAHVILSPKETIKNAHKETFEQAMARLGVTEMDLVRNYKNFALICYVSLFFSLICFLGCFYQLFFQMNILGALSMLAIMLFCLANAFKFSFRAFQIRHQKLCPISDWWNRASEWLPRL